MEYSRVKTLKAGQVFYGVNTAGGWATKWTIVFKQPHHKRRWVYLVCRVKTISNPGGVSLMEDTNTVCWYQYSCESLSSAMKYTRCRGQALRWAEESARERQWRIKLDEQKQNQTGSGS